MASGIRHASIIPLIGGETIGSEQAFGSRPDFILSWSPFRANDSHLLNYYGHEVPYYVLDEVPLPRERVDVVSSVCPCAGLSMLSNIRSGHNEKNEWMVRCAELVLSEVRPEVYWGENAPVLSSDLGAPVRARLYEIARKNGYSMSLYRTKALLHGVPQVRARTFYFFWKGDRVPILDYYARPHVRVEDLLLEASRSNFQTEPTNPRRPSEAPIYRFILEHLMGGIGHVEYASRIERTVVAVDEIQKMGVTFAEAAEWMRSKGFEYEAAKCERRHAKIMAGGRIMNWSVIIPRDYTQAFISHAQTTMAFPYEDRYISYREAMSLMGMPTDFELLDPKRNLNHVCQNVPVPAARDMATEVLAHLEGRRETIDATYVFQNNMSRTHEVWDRPRGATLEGFIG